MASNRAKFTDEQFIEGLRTGDNEVLQALYRKYYQLVLKFIISNSGTEDAAKDIYQETVIVLYENALNPSFELRCQLQTYIYSVARKLWLTYLRKNGKTFLFRDEGDHEVADVNADMDEHLSREREIAKMNAGLEQLGEPCGALLRDFYTARLSMEEIAEKFGYTNADNAKNQKYKCLQRLKKYFFDKKTIEQD
jgi:RNA polymerase sigma factor (sigma-70 family)